MRIMAGVLAVTVFAVLLPGNLHAQAGAAELADSLRQEVVWGRGFVRAAETQYTKVLSTLVRLRALLEPAEPDAPPTVQDWRTGEWGIFAGGYRGVLDLDAGTATTAGVTAPAVVTFSGDTLRARLDVPGHREAGILTLVHAEGRMIGTVRYLEEERPASGQRELLEVVRTEEADGCTFALYTDGSWGIAPNTSACHQALDARQGGMRFVARVYEP